VVSPVAIMNWVCNISDSDADVIKLTDAEVEGGGVLEFIVRLRARQYIAAVCLLATYQMNISAAGVRSLSHNGAEPKRPPQRRDAPRTMRRERRGGTCLLVS